LRGEGSGCRNEDFGAEDRCIGSLVFAESKKSYHMFRQEQLLKKLQAIDIEAFKEVLTGVGPLLIDYCIDRLGNRERGEGMVFYLFLRWTMTGFASATCPLAEWMAWEVEGECERMAAGLN
jgi:hypothetical protein